MESGTVELYRDDAWIGESRHYEHELDVKRLNPGLAVRRIEYVHILKEQFMHVLEGGHAPKEGGGVIERMKQKHDNTR